jgi:hypothetical protein
MPAPSAPSANTVVLQTGNGQNLVSWPLVSGATSYQVQRATDGITFANIGSPVTVPFYTDSAVLIGGTYYYQVNAINISGSSAFTPSYPASITPCLPGQINLGYMRYQSQLRSDQLNAQFLTVDEWNFNINQFAFELYDILVTKFGDDYFFAPPLQIPLTGAQSYPIPNGANYSAAPALYKLNGIDANVSGAAQGPNAGWTSRSAQQHLSNVLSTDGKSDFLFPTEYQHARATLVCADLDTNASRYRHDAVFYLRME